MVYVWKSVKLAVFMAGMLAGTMAWGAGSQASCDQRIRTAEHRLHQSIRRYGAKSRQAQKRRQQLDRVRSRCHM